MARDKFKDGVLWGLAIGCILLAGWNTAQWQAEKSLKNAIIRQCQDNGSFGFEFGKSYVRYKCTIKTGE